jgi:hypothetical protein
MNEDEIVLEMEVRDLEAGGEKLLVIYDLLSLEVVDC